jgi:hypothetical protein
MLGYLRNGNASGAAGRRRAAQAQEGLIYPYLFDFREARPIYGVGLSPIEGENTYSGSNIRLQSDVGGFWTLALMVQGTGNRVWTLAVEIGSNEFAIGSNDYNPFNPPTIWGMVAERDVVTARISGNAYLIVSPTNSRITVL